MNTFGLRHAALKVHNPQRSKEFYMRVLKMELEWEPDTDNIYLTSGGQDNLAIHKAEYLPSGPQQLDHIGFALPTPEDVDAWYEWVQSQDVDIVQGLKTHRDGAKSFYFKDPDDIVVQMIYHPPIARAQVHSSVTTISELTQSPH